MKRTRKQPRRSKLLAGSLAFLFLLAVSVTLAPAAAPPAEVKPAAQQEAKPEAAPPQMPEYRYDQKGKIDPFKPFVRLELPTATKKDPEKKKLSGNLTPLQRVALDKVRVTGIAGSSAKRVAWSKTEGARATSCIWARSSGPTAAR